MEIFSFHECHGLYAPNPGVNGFDGGGTGSVRGAAAGGAATDWGENPSVPAEGDLGTSDALGAETVNGGVSGGEVSDGGMSGMGTAGAGDVGPARYRRVTSSLFEALAPCTSETVTSAVHCSLALDDPRALGLDAGGTNTTAWYRAVVPPVEHASIVAADAPDETQVLPPLWHDPASEG